MKILASIVYAVGVIAAGFLLWWVVLGCAGVQVKDEPQEPFDLKGWVVIADIELAEWNKLPVESQVSVALGGTMVSKNVCPACHDSMPEKNLVGKVLRRILQ